MNLRLYCFPVLLQHILRFYQLIQLLSNEGSKQSPNYIVLIIKETALAYIKNQCKKKFEKIQIGFAWHIKNKRRDPDNIRSADKYVLDALVQSEVIPDDNLKHIVGFLGDIFILNKDCDKVEVFIKEIE